jgi:DNA repair protein RecN (Recombination protein N)
MLKKLYIKNYALIDKMSVEFGPGLNILTGETGVGKSIILGALSLLLGERAKTDVIRSGASMAVVEGLFDVPSSVKLETADSQVFTDLEDLLLRREIHQSGRSRSFANDSPISNSLLSAIGDLLIDLHGQHEHQTILKVDHHLDYLDNYGTEEELLARVKGSFKQFRSHKTKLEDLKQRETRLHEKRELLEFQVQEIAKADPKEGEEESLESEERILRNSERIFQASNQITNLLYDGEGSVSEKLSATESALSGLVEVDPLFEKWMKECEST